MADNNTHTNNTEIGGIGLVTVLLALIFLFVWPGPLRYEYHVPANHGSVLRIDRLNGHVQIESAGRFVNR